ncbi:MAG: carbamoyltransferase C-terminal domain-containing protein [Candidatus Omnitrophota bacterium]|nr:carbamoyltransferase C-terminal domain-containing protein [Candidatus Omnitrophota bacterium]
MIIVGINAYHPDASVALLRDGEVIWAAEEERYSRIKHASGFPKLALRKCLEDTKTLPSAIDAVAISKNPRANMFKKMSFVWRQKPNIGFVLNRLKAFRKSSGFERDFFEALNISLATLKAKFVHVEHHIAHVASSFYFSGYERAAFLSLDGLGDFSSAMWGVGRGNELRVSGRVYFPHSAGFLYSAATQFLGFHHFGDEYKVMGLAAYGKARFKNEIGKMVRLLPAGKFGLDLDYFVHQEGQSKVRWEGGAPEQDIMFSKKWEDIFGPAREPKTELTERDKDIAASTQEVLEEIYFHVLRNLYEQCGEKNLCLAGGVAFNSVANGKIKKETPFENIYIQPAAGDAGTAVGAAAFVYRTETLNPRTSVMNHAYFGSAAGTTEIEKAMRAKDVGAESCSDAELIRRTVDALAAGKVVGWFQGRMEFGPRALGARSILVDPRRPEMKDILNERIKRRETFRPFAPAVIEEEAANYFDMDVGSSPFMLMVFPVKEDKKTLLPAITHVDGTARVQTVSRESHPRFWSLIKAFGDKTGVPILLNTSFNENEPIVCSAADALDCYLKTRMEVLVMENYYLEK